jgi:predicted permease
VSVYSDVLTPIIPLFALILFGYLAKKTRLLHVTDAPVLNRFVISITLPAFVFHALLSHHLRADLLALPFIFWIAEALVLLIGRGSTRLLKWSGPQIGTLLLESIFGNTGYIGYPMTTAVLPIRLPAAVIIDQFGMSIPLYAGAPILGGFFGNSRIDVRPKIRLDFLRSPAFLALATGILVRLIPQRFVPTEPVLVNAGALFMKVIGLVGGVTVPVVLIAVGLLLRPSSLARHSAQVALIGLLKLIVLPIVTWLTARFVFHITGTLLEVCVLQASMPPAATATVFAGQYDMDGSLAIASFFALTVASALTIPLMLSLLR